MKLYIKQKVFSWGDKFNIYDENGDTYYYCEGKAFTMWKKLRLYDRNGTELAFIHQKPWSFLPRYFVQRNGTDIAEVVKRFSVKPKYDVNGLDWFVSGKFLEHEFTIEANTGIIAHITKKWFSWGDTFEIDMADGVDPVNAVSIVLIIDAVMTMEAAAASGGAS